MVPIKHILYENGVKEIFKFIVPSGNFQGEYVINKPDGWDDTNSIVNIDDILLNVKDFIIGDNVKLKFYQFSNKVGYDVLYNVYQEQGGDGRIIFKYIGVKDGIEYDLLKDNFEVNLNKYPIAFDKSMFKIEIELIKSEAQNKLFNRDDITIDLFAEKDLDENVITPVETFEIGYKKGASKQSNFYSWDASQYAVNLTPRTDHFFSFVRSDEYDFGNNTNQYCGFSNLVNGSRIDQGPFVSTNLTLKSIKIEVSNMNIVFGRDNALLPTPIVHLCAVIYGPGIYYTQKLKTSVAISGQNYSEIKIDNESFSLNINNSSNISPGQNLTFLFLTDDSNDKYTVAAIKTNTSIEVTTNMESPIIKTRGVRLLDAIKQVVKNYTASGLGVISNYIGLDGTFYNTSISTGVYLRGLPPVYTAGQKIKTSFKSLITDGAAKLLALGYDIIDNNVVVEDIKYFFKDIQIYDLTEKVYIQEGFKFENDKDIVFNTMLFGSKKYSKNVKDDIQNFITSAEFATPIKSTKSKFDKQTELIIDEYKIQELIEDKSTSTNDNDDDLVMIDMVNQFFYQDSGVFENCIHANKAGKLTLTCTVTPFDTTMMEVGNSVQITEGLNAGYWIILNINKIELTLNKTSNIAEGVNDTPITYTINNITKNRSIRDGFTDEKFVRNPETSTNARHNPKYHMARWFSWFGSGLRKKTNTDLIKVTNYKNNEKAQMKTNSSDLSNELPGLIEVGANENLGRLREYAQPFFSGDVIEISYVNVTFKEFIMLYENWRYGISGERMKSRGFVTLNTPLGIYDAYPFGDSALSHDRKTNVLSFKGKIKGRSAKSPVLLTVVQDNSNTVTLHWDYGTEYANPTIDIQYSADGINWLTVKQFVNVKQGTITDNVFNNFLTGTDMHFRLIVNTSDLINKISNTVSVKWKFNPFTIVIVNKAEEAECGYSRLVIDLNGKGNFNIEYDYTFQPSGGKLYVTNMVGSVGNVNVESPYGSSSLQGTENKAINVNNETVRLFIELLNSDKTESLIPLNCKVGNYTYSVSANLIIKFTDTITNTIRTFDLKSITDKKYN